MTTIGGRLREERQRLGMNQSDFGAHGGVKKVAQIHYEQDERSPDVDYLAGIATAGADVLYIVTGHRRTPAGSFDPALLRRVLESAEEALRTRRQRLAPAKKAELVSLLYEHFGEVKNVERGTVERFLRLVA